RARRLEALAPTIWCWRYFREHGASSEPFVSATGWQIELLPTRSGAPASVYSTAQDVQDIFSSLSRWLPRARLSQGVFKVDETIISIQDADWLPGKLSARLELPRIPQPFALTARVGAGWPAVLRLDCDSLRLQSR